VELTLTPVVVLRIDIGAFSDDEKAVVEEACTPSTLIPIEKAEQAKLRKANGPLQNPGQKST